VPLVTDDARVREMAAAAATIGEREADERLADLVVVAADSRGAR
jgi:UDP-N-acetylglucosamine--N-acetylmuramyl-(pentapeptide) pyrophosphoryl-undecaprenol N-acetylglucosamine transferase